ncbi:MAG: efflux transporter outer membrane subunit [Burkholderiaceae bacterium]|nr:efflux transporter outer membrane subunit [Burkholderiaceae bacterium]
MRAASEYRGKKYRRTVVSLGVIYALSACAVGPDFKKPVAPISASYTVAPISDIKKISDIDSGAAQRFIEGKDIEFEWWRQFECPQLNSLVQRAFKANPTVTAAQANLKQAMELVYAQQGYFFPTVGAGYNVQRQLLAGNMGGNSPGIQGNGSVISTYQNPSGPAPYNGGVIYNMHTAQVTVGYTPDVFGANRRAVESLDAQARVAQFQMEATYITLASNVVAAAIQEASVRAQLAATRQLIKDNEKALEILQTQFKSGFVMRMDVAAQESALAQARQALPPLEKQFEQTRDLIRMLAGNMPGTDVSEVFEFKDLHLPEDLPASLPSKLIEQRPDVRAAEEQMRSANAQVGSAVAARLPQFSITGAWGGTATEFNQMFATGGPFWSLITGFTQTVFDGNTLKHRQLSAEQGLIQAAEQYRSTVLTAYQNVADTLHAIESDADALKAASDAEAAAKITLDLTRQQETIGFVNYQTYLAAEMAYQQSRLALIQAQASRFGDTAALYQALGGGWWNRDKVAGTATSASAQ